ncbi:MAG: LacI family DNA-binding transcriptional regulator [Burkholderiaceae bacterium]
MIDVARQAGVSTMTVSRALRNPHLVSRATRARVETAVDDMGYVLDLSAGALSTGRSGFVACLVPSLNNSNFSETVHAISEVLQASGLQLLLSYTDYSIEAEESLVKTMLQRRPEAVIITGNNHTELTRRLLGNYDGPVIQMWDSPTDPIDHVVGFSNAQACGDMVRTLQNSGYRKIGFIGGTSNQQTRGADRLQGFVQTTTELGLPTDRVISFGEPPISMKQGALAIVQTLEKWPDTDAVVCVSDSCAFGAITECARRGWDVPGRVAIAGFGDSEIAASNQPSITTVKVGCTAIGHAVGRIVHDSLAARVNGDTLPAQIVKLEYEIIVRESTGKGSAQSSSTSQPDLPDEH